MVPHLWILESVTLAGIAENIKRLLKNSMGNWKTELNACGTSLDEVNIWQGIFQGDSLSPLLFIIAIIPLTHVLRHCDKATSGETVTARSITCCSWMTSNCTEEMTEK